MADVVSAERQHRHRIASHSPNRTGGRSGCFRSHRRAQIYAMVPIERLINQRHGIAAAAPENDRADRDAFAFLDVEVERGVVAYWRGEAAVGVRRFFF